MNRRDALLVLARRKRIVQALTAELHDMQRQVVSDLSRYIALLCGRRSGKTELVARLVASAIVQCGDNEWVVFGARTQAIAKDLIWSHLVRINEEYQLGWKLSEHTGLIRAPNGARFRVFGVDDKVAIDKVRGYKIRLACFDEASTYDDLLPGLVEALGPALTDLSGRLVLSGTPGSVTVGYWYEASTGDVSTYPETRRYSRHKWTVLENSKYPRDPHEMLREEREAFGWTEDDESYLREYFGLWVNNPSALVYALNEQRNVVSELPVPFDRDTWLTTIGVDFGYTDECGWVVWGSPPHSQEVFALHAVTRSGLLADEAAEVTAELAERYKPATIEGDGGGLGKPYVEEFNRRWAAKHKIQISYAEKTDKPGAISLYNSDLRAGRTKYLRGEADALIHEQRKLPWVSLTKRVEHPSYPNHCSDAGLYGWRKHHAYWQRPKRPDKSQAEIDAEARAKRIRSASKVRGLPWYERA